MLSSRVRSFWHDWGEICTSLAKSQRVIHLSSWTASQIHTFSSTLCLNGYPATLTVTTFLRLENEYNVWILLIVSCLKTSLNISHISIAVLPAAQALFFEICFSDEMQVAENLYLSDSSYDIEMCGKLLSNSALPPPSRAVLS